jgi:hypothetical protein
MFAQILTEKTALIIATFVGMAMCTVGIGQVAERGQWTEPLSIVSYVLGGLVLVITGATLFDIRLPLIDSPRTALIVVVGIAILKIAITQLHHVFA